ncbi:MAG: benzoate-CoA ligase family protein [Pigmentiphaga sp.]|uniref:benzoate-CoA ligase family protein n=1 Tax=Pigmentiphaga sp. TaxID=1977564 RepID=UPI0029B9C746|nr:benzoate-CoA ligase family protein [Pigmentiphaga sp.]MDX3907512.1 benzoate-CoA ligase family protein [Pigmentiphaga sp.]
MERSGHLDTFARDHLPPPEAWPDFLLDHPAVRYPARFNCAAELVDGAVAAGHGDRPAIQTFIDGKLTVIRYRELQERVDRLARVLTEDMGLVAGNRVLLRGPNNPAMAVALLATIKAGMVAVPTMPLLRAAELKPILDRAQVRAALCDVRLRDELEACMREGAWHCPTLAQVRFFNDDGPESLESLARNKPVPFSPCDTASDDVCLIAFTSGTTGSPKGCMHFHRDVLAMCDLFPRYILEARPDDIFCGTPPLAFTFGLGGMLCFPLRVGASTVLAEKLTPAALLETIQATRATIVFTAPTFYRQMAALADGYDISSVRHAVSAGEALPDATRQSWKQATGVEMTDGIGSTEMIHIFISSAGDQVRRGAIGKVVPGYEVRIVDDEMRPVPPGTIGKLAVRGPTGCKYLADERQANVVQQGWNLTGDSFVMDEDGYLYYQARTDDMIISAGYNIAGPEVESALLQHEAVAECGVVGVPDEERGQVVTAFVVLRPGVQAGEALAKVLQEHVKQTIAPYKYPRVIRFVDALPRTETGKLKRFALRSL